MTPNPNNPPEAGTYASRWLFTAVLNFFFAGCLGALLRYAFVSEVPGLNFRNVMHGHSHVAMLGWLYMALFALLVRTFIPEKEKTYNRLFWMTQVSIAGMLVSFPVQGYGPVSIAFSTLHIILSYVFAVRFFRDIKRERTQGRLSVRLVKASLWFMLVSTLGLWGMGPVMALDMKGSVWYHVAVQFYLHFQFNGWFLFAVLALWFRMREAYSKETTISRLFFALLVVSCLLTFSLVLVWANTSPAFLVVNGLGVIMQLAALVLLGIMMREDWPQVASRLSRVSRWLIAVALISFAVKIALQALVVIPAVATIAFTIRNYVIGFIHLIMLGAISHFIWGYSAEKNLIDLRSWGSKTGLVLFFVGFAGSEILLFLQGTMFWAAKGFLPGYYEILFGFSVLMPLGVGGIAGSRKFYLQKQP
ncbi:MAG: hypothetical protein SF052_14625 [Bacteroidia bacterium]|nr:hypothetical protein [Bacteroidia bacterium]